MRSLFIIFALLSASIMLPLAQAGPARIIPGCHGVNIITGGSSGCTKTGCSGTTIILNGEGSCGCSQGGEDCSGCSGTTVIIGGGGNCNGGSGGSGGSGCGSGYNVNVLTGGNCNGGNGTGDGGRWALATCAPIPVYPYHYGLDCCDVDPTLDGCYACPGEVGAECCATPEACRCQDKTGNPEPWINRECDTLPSQAPMSGPDPEDCQKGGDGGDGRPPCPHQPIRIQTPRPRPPPEDCDILLLVYGQWVCVRDLPGPLPRSAVPTPASHHEACDPRQGGNGGVSCAPPGCDIYVRIQHDLNACVGVPGEAQVRGPQGLSTLYPLGVLA